MPSVCRDTVGLGMLLVAFTCYLVVAKDFPLRAAFLFGSCCAFIVIGSRVAETLALCTFRTRTAVALGVAAVVRSVTSLFLILFVIVGALGLSIWGYFPTLDVVIPYIAQSGTLLTTLGFSIAPFLMFSLALLLMLFLASVFSLRRVMDSSIVQSLCVWLSVRTRLRLSLAWLGLVSILPASCYAYLSWGSSRGFSEPFTLFFAPPQNVQVQNSERERDEIDRLHVLEAEIAASYQASPTKQIKHVIVITVDALRPDRMGVYGYSRETTPFLSSLHERGSLQVVQHARATCAESMCGLVSLLNGRDAHESPWLSFGLADVLKKAGYATHAVLGGDHTNFYGLKQRLGSFDSYSDGTAGDAALMNDDSDVLARLRNVLKQRTKQPQFFLVHLMSSHGLGKKHAKYATWLPQKHPARLLVGEIDQTSISQIGNYYDNGVLQVDSYIKAIFEELEDEGLLEQALVIVTADHGEYLGEHGKILHANGLHEPVLRIPLLIFRGKTADETVRSFPIIRQADLAPTVLDEIGLIAPRNWTGKAIGSAHPRANIALHSQGDFSAILDTTSANKSYKMIYDRRTATAQVFDLSNDPKETKDIASLISRTQLRVWYATLMGANLLTPRVRSKDDLQNADIAKPLPKLKDI
jgi:glucan phosphoethanolaminetransferase (alkaline phosphatase superfamily)